MKALFQPLKVGRITIKNRIVQSPLTRLRSTDSHVPTELMVKHYADRASYGLLVAESSMIQEGYSTFGYEPGIYNQEQVEAWKRVTDAVHKKGGHIFLQLHHGGRSAPLANLDAGLQVVSASKVQITKFLCYSAYSRRGQKETLEVPTPIPDSELPRYTELYATASQMAITAGFDGIELHGGSSYLIDQFLKSSSNQRPAPYGGSIENRCRFPLEAVGACCREIGGDRVAIRISPINSFNEMVDESPEELTTYFASKLNDFNLAYLHTVRGDFFAAPKGPGSAWARKVYKGVLIDNMSYTPQEAEEAVAAGKVDAVAFGVTSIANPDLPQRLRTGAPLNTPDKKTFYSRDGKGYNDYPTI